MKKILVNHPERNYEAEVDDEDYDFLSQHRWSASVRRTTTYANTSILTKTGVWKGISMHRMVIGDAEEDWLRTHTGYTEEHLDNGKTIYFIPDRYRRLRTV